MMSSDADDMTHGEDANEKDSTLMEWRMKGVTQCITKELILELKDGVVEAHLPLAVDAATALRLALVP